MRYFFIAAGAVLALTLIFVVVGTAQEKAPQFPDQIKKLFVFVGNWEGQGIMTQTGQQPQNIKITHKNTMLANKWGVMSEEQAVATEMPVYLATDIWGYDAGSDMMHMYTVSNYGETHDHKGKWVDDKHLNLEYNGQWDGKPMVERLNITFPDSQTYSFADTVFMGGQQIQVLQATMKKVAK